MLTDMHEIEQTFAARSLRGSRLHHYLAPMLAAFAASGARDENYLIELSAEADGPFWSRIWEAMLYWRFRQLGWAVSGPGAGPDFHVEMPTGPVYVEAAVPSPDGLPPSQLVFEPGVVKSTPHEQILLRWTSKIADKRAKHIDDIAKGQADVAIPFVIAINSCRLGYMPEECGITQWPYAVEATFPVGPWAVPIHPETREIGEPFQSLRFSVAKRPGVHIPTGNFLDLDYACVSALVGCAACYADDEIRAKFAGQPPFFVVHNPLAANPLPLNWLPDAIEYAAVRDGEDEFILSRLTPRS